jgi:hypothetical protein
MVAAVGIQAPQGEILVTYSQTVEAVNAAQFRAIVAYNIPAVGMNAAQGRIKALIHENAVIAAPQARILAAVRGRAANPRVRAWTFTLDGHDFYVLRLGDRETLVYDLSTKQWVNWDSFGNPFWRPNTGFSWVGGQSLAHQYGSNIVVGDDTWGLLWFLDPEQPYDDHPDQANPTQQLEFSRVVMGQFPARGRDVMSCSALFLAGDNYGIVADDFTPAVTLSYSDDGGKSFVSADTITVTPDTVNQPYSWRSLGQISNPGRLFKITDNGVFTRIDDLKMNDD